MSSIASDIAGETVDFGLKTEIPLLLLPVRLETRFRGNTLLIRVYPDGVHIDSFERGLSPVEIEWGQHYWTQRWLTMSADDNERLDRQYNIWSQLAQLFGSRRAAWIATQMQPVNLGDAPAGTPRFPTNVPRLDPQKPHTPCTTLLPDFWLASGSYSYVDHGEKKTESFAKPGNAVKSKDADRICVMPSLARIEGRTTIKEDPDAGWLVDFEKAKEIGMGLTLDLPTVSPEAGFKIDQLFVYGVKASLEAQKSVERVQQLIEAHHYTQGLGFVAQGTPTNNTLATSSGYTPDDHGSPESYEIEISQVASTNPLSNHRILAKALGINPDYLIHLQEANAEEQEDAREMNQILWKSTCGHFLEEMLELESAHGDAIEKMREHFVRYVRARGPLPALRIGSQPYGVLPVMALGEEGSDAVKTGAVACLRALREIWLESRKKENLVPRLKKGADNSLTVLQVLAMSPTGLDYVGRNCTRIVPVASDPSPEGLKETGRRPLPPDLQKALDAALGQGDTRTPHQRTVFTTRSSLFGVDIPLVGSHDFEENDNSSLLNLLRDRTGAAAEASKVLRERPEPIRDRLLRETLDLCSHRLDAWITSLATERLEKLREQSTGLCIGGYGWVENLEPDPPKANYGYIHAPSLAHATSAAILRSGYQSRKLSEEPRDSNALAINLSSERVRLAMHLLDGVRGGQSLGALLGYRFERALHERNLDEYIPTFRKIAPGSTELLAPGSKDKFKHLVLDGLALLETSLDWNSEDLRGAPQAELQAELDHLAEAVDAVADLLLAESVHHVAQGNHVQAGATLEAIARGETPPPEIQFIRTPRTGINHTHRIALVFGSSSSESPWGITAPRAKAEPVLNEWVGHVLGPDAKEAPCTVTFTDPAESEPQKRSVTFSHLGLAPIDLVYLLDGELGGQTSEVEQRIIRYVKESVPSAVITSLDFARSTDETAPKMGEVLEITRSIRRLITGARVLESRDLDLPEDVVEGTPERDPGLITRATAARTAFGRTVESLRVALSTMLETSVTDTVLSALRQALTELSGYGVMGSIPVNPADTTEAGLRPLRSQAETVLAEANGRKSLAQSIATEIQTNAQAIRVLTTLFGDDFKVLPAFTPNNSEELSKTFKSAALQDTASLESIMWFQRIARVRDGAARLDATMQYSEALNGLSLAFQIGQLPYREGERWVGLENPPLDSRLSLVCMANKAPDFTQALSGLLIDEWVETVPNKEEMTGVAFHYDAPQPKAPQALLLAVAPEGISVWNSTILENTLRETLELAKLRAVDLTALGKLGQYLPALYVDAAKIPQEFRRPLGNESR